MHVGFQYLKVYYLQDSRSESFTLYNVEVDPAEPDKMGPEGIYRLLQDLKLAPDSRLVLIMAWKMRAATQCEFTRDEFQNGLVDLA